MGTVSHSHSSTLSSQASQQLVRLGEMRQHICGDVSRQDDQSAEPIPVPVDGPSPALVKPSQDLHSSSPPFRSKQHLDLQPVEERDSHQWLNKALQFVSGLAPEQDSGLHTRCNVDQLEHGTRFVFPPIALIPRILGPHPSGPGKTLQVQELLPDPHSSQMALPDVVHKASDNGSRRCDSPSPLEGSHPDSGVNSSTMSRF